MTTDKKEFECCPEFIPDPWDIKIIVWENKKFIKDKVQTFFFIPINFGKKMRHLDAEIRKADANIPDWLCLSDHISSWRMDIYLAVDKDVEGQKMINLSGKYYSRVYEGDFKETKAWCQDYNLSASNQGLKTGKMYMWYTSCPKCAKKFGKNYVVILSEVLSSE